jgi:hypothetical protein
MSKYAYLAFSFAAVLLITAAILFFESSKKAEVSKVAEITSLRGEVSLRDSETGDETKLTANGTLRAHEVLVTGPDGSATLVFRNGLNLNIKGNSRLVTEFETTGHEKVMVTVLDGHVEFSAVGSDDTVRVFKNGTLLTKDAPDVFSPLIISSEEKASPPADDVSITAAQPEETPAPSSETLAEEKLKANPDDEKLDNLEIEDAIVAKRNYFQRCYLGYLQRNGQTSKNGRVTMGFVIENNGKVSSQKIVQSPFSDETLNNCLLEVVSRITFQSFSGARISVAEFPIELK